MRRSWTAFVTAATAGLVATAAARGQWVQYEQQPFRLSAPDELGALDVDEKDYAWADIDQDGDIDLVVVRKEPFTTTGKRVNVLLMNEGTAEGHAVNGVLVDRTAEYVSASDVAGDQGFLTPTNDRDVVLADLDGDGWLDMVTAVTLTDKQAKHLSHPRIYMNLGADEGGAWLGFRYEDARIPTLHEIAGPRFCSVAAGDVTGDGAPDLYFGDYDTPTGTMIFDFNNRLLINDGSGFFTDETTDRLTFEMYNAAFGAASVIADMNGDGVNDIVKQTSLNAPTHVAVTYNDPSNEGVFMAYDTINSASPYFVSVGHLNGDGMLDAVITDDGTDRYLLNIGNNALGQADFISFTLEGSGGFGSNSVIADLNNDGDNDILIADVDVDVPGCGRSLLIYRNLGNEPTNSFAQQGAPIPADQVTGVHDVGVFDLNGDGWLDLVLGRCSGTQVWVNLPPDGLVFSYPQGLPAYVAPDQASQMLVQVDTLGEGELEPGSGRLHLSVEDGPMVESVMTPLGGGLFSATFPAVPCSGRLSFYVSAELAGGTAVTDPPQAPLTTYSAVAAEGLDLALRDEIEGDVSAWTVQSQSLLSGGWEQADPNGTVFNGGTAAPDDDATAGVGNVMAFVTQNGAPEEGPADNDVDGGPTRLISPPIDLDGTDGIVTYSRWFYSDGGATHEPDFMTVDVSNDDGQTWTPVPEHTTGGTAGAWETVWLLVGDYVTPTATVRVRFTALDEPNNSVTEAGIDDFQVEVFSCPAACPADLNGDGIVGVADLLQLFVDWGSCADCASDLDSDGQVGVSDFIELLISWGTC